MGQSSSLPDPNVKLQVIGAGMPRTGTTSFAEAVGILLGGPVYHGGTSIFSREESHIKGWIEVLNKTPIKSEEDRTFVLQGVKELISGYSVCTDMPPAMFTGELVEVFPDAKVICTTRDPVKWWGTCKAIFAKADNQLLFKYIFALLPTLRWFQTYAESCRDGRFGELFYTSGDQHPHSGMYKEHMEYLERVVPKDRLYFYDVKDGWEPLCKILDRPVPDVPFPRLNDGASSEAFFKKLLMKAIYSWLGLTSAVVIAAGIAARYIPAAWQGSSNA